MNEAPMILVSGPSGVGKTTDMLYAFPNATFIAVPGALEPARTTCGFEVPSTRIRSDIKTLDQVVPVVLNAKGPIIIDDLTLLADQTVLIKKASMGGYDLWGFVLDRMLEIRVASRKTGNPVAFNCHETPAETQNGEFHAGTISLQGKARTKLPPAFDIFARAQPLAREVGWPACYRVKIDDPTFQPTRDRYNAIYDQAPLNLAEALRSVGLKMPRIPELDWAEAFVEKLAGLLVDSISDVKACRGILEQAKDHVAGKVKNILHVNWILRDGYDRAVIRVGRRARVHSLFCGEKPKTDNSFGGL
jgi:hypothetical protein